MAVKRVTSCHQMEDYRTGNR